MSHLSTEENTAPKAAARSWRPLAAWAAFEKRYPFVALFVWILISNVTSTLFNFLYNKSLIVDELLDESQKVIFWTVAAPVFNGLVWPICLTWAWLLVRPLVRCRRRLLAGETVRPAELERCRRRLLNMPVYLVGLSCLGWLPGAVLFPSIICTLGGSHNAAAIWVQFIISFVMAALFTTVQTFTIIERFLTATLYPDFFQDARPADVAGVFRLSFSTRLRLLWAAVAIAPLLSLFVVTFNLLRTHPGSLLVLAIGVTLVGGVVGGLIFFTMGRDLRAWLDAHAAATKQIAQENFDVAIPGKRPDEWGRLTDRFNDMATALQRAQYVRETFGQMVGPEVRDEILERYPGVGGEVQEVTVLFADIRGFTRRSAGQDPGRVFELLNRFFSLMAHAIAANGGTLDKFLGDGALALFGAPRHYEDHADRAVAAAVGVVAELARFNDELSREGQEPLAIGIGIHTGPALVGCVGATLQLPGRVSFRKEFTAIGETVNLAQRIEQLTKTHGGPILISEQTHGRLRRSVPATPLGPQPVPGCAETMCLFRLHAYSA